MNENQAKFCLQETNNQVKVEINGNGGALISMLASAISQDENIEMIVKMAFLRVLLDRDEDRDDIENIPTANIFGLKPAEA